jgi:ABC-2 type transport system ATP-binding protein
MLLGLVLPTSGTVEVLGAPIPKQARSVLYRVGALVEAPAAYGHLGARANLSIMDAAGPGGSRRTRKARIDEALEQVGLAAVGRRPVKAYSLGMRQRLGIAAALLGDPAILMFDEPVNGLDPEGIMWIRTLMKQLAGEGRTVFVSSHLMSEMENTADHLIVIGRGRLIADCSVAEFIERNSVQAVRVRTPQPDALVAAIRRAGGGVAATGEAIVIHGLAADKVGDLAYENGIRLHELAMAQASLEEAFMELTAASVEFRAGAGPAAEQAVEQGDRVSTGGVA